MKYNTQNIIDVLNELGYDLLSGSYKRISTNNIHWISFFDSGHVDLCAYSFTSEPDMDQPYNTGLIDHLTPTELELLIREVNIKYD